MDLDVLASGDVGNSVAVFFRDCGHSSHLMRKDQTGGQTDSEHEISGLTLVVNSEGDMNGAKLRVGK